MVAWPLAVVMVSRPPPAPASHGLGGLPRARDNPPPCSYGVMRRILGCASVSPGASAAKCSVFRRKIGAEPPQKGTAPPASAEVSGAGPVDKLTAIAVASTPPNSRLHNNPPGFRAWTRSDRRLLADWHAMHLVMFQLTPGVTDLELGDRITLIVSDSYNGVFRQCGGC